MGQCSRMSAVRARTIAARPSFATVENQGLSDGKARKNAGRTQPDAALSARSPRRWSGWRRPRCRARAARAGDAFVWEPAQGGLIAGGAGRQHAAVAAQGHRCRARHAAREHAPLRRRPARQQRAAVGRARHGQELAGQGGACRGQPRPQGQGATGADRDPPRGDREPAAAAAPAARRRSAASCSIATIFPSTRTTPATNR